MAVARMIFNKCLKIKIFLQIALIINIKLIVFLWVFGMKFDFIPFGPIDFKQIFFSDLKLFKAVIIELLISCYTIITQV